MVKGAKANNNLKEVLKGYHMTLIQLEIPYLWTPFEAFTIFMNESYLIQNWINRIYTEQKQTMLTF